MFETSSDILLITVAVCIALLTVFSCWGIFYVVQIIRRGFLAIKGVEEVIDNFNDLIKETKKRVEHSAAYISVISEGVKKAVELVKDTKEGGGKKKRKKK